MLRTAVAISLFLARAFAADQYTFGPDSARQPNVPTGKLTQHQWKSQIFPGTLRDYWVYLPAQYKPDTPAAVMVFQDGAGVVKEDGNWRIPIVFDNLIHKGEMPVTIGIFIDPGVLPPPSSSQQGRFNRSYEYDGLTDRYARFLIEEILPEVGKTYKLTNDPNLRAIAGSSSGGIAAFTAAWHRPDYFRRVMSFIGSYTNLRGGDIWANLIRKMEPKPLRIYLQDGRNDQNIWAGNWFAGNQTMHSALAYAGYDTTFVIGDEEHNMKHGGAIMPDALRWLWKDWTKPIPKPKKEGNRQEVMLVLDPASEWEPVSENHKFTEGPAVDREGNVFFTDIPNNRIHRIDAKTGKVSVWKEDSGGANGLMFGGDGRLYAAQNGRKRIVAYSPDGIENVVVDGTTSNDVAVAKDGGVYFTDPPNKRVWYVDAKGNKRVVHEGIGFPNGVVLSPDQSLLMVADSASRFVWSFQVQPDGSLANGQPFYRLEMADEAAPGVLRGGADGMTVDTLGYLYVATPLGIQICDQPGRVVGIIEKPEGRSPSNVVFGGPNLDTLYVTARDRVYRRHLRRKGVIAWQTVMPPRPRL